MKQRSIIMFISAICFIRLLFSGYTPTFAEEKQRIFDEAQVLTSEEIEQLENRSAEYSELQETDFILLTIKEGGTVDTLHDYVLEEYEQQGFGYNGSQGNAVILAIDVHSRNVYIAGFGKAETYLNDDGIEFVLDEIEYMLSDEQYADAFDTFMSTASQEMDDTFEWMQDEIGEEISQPQVELVEFTKETPNMKVFDAANLLSSQEKARLEKIADESSQIRETDFITLLVDHGLNEFELMRYIEDMYDLNGFGFDKRHGNAAVMAIDLNSRTVYIAGFYKAESLLDNYRIELVLDDIEGYLATGDYSTAVEQYIKSAATYMKYKEGVPPDSIFLNSFFQLIIGLVIACAIVGAMVYRSGGRKTTTDRTYRDENSMRVLDKYDRYVRTTVTKVRKPSNNNNGGGGSGGGGGRSSGGHSHSGGGRSF